MQKELTNFIVHRLAEEKEALQRAFFTKHPIAVARHFVLDNLLPAEIATAIYQAYPKPKHMHLLSKYGEIKLKYCRLKDAAALLQDINAAIQDPSVIALVEEITQIKHQEPDPSKFAGGVSMLLKGYYINPHLDNSHDVDRKLYRTVNVLYYVSPDWQQAYGGNYELWDSAIRERLIVPNLFNRLVVMETNQSSWHAVNPVLHNAPRCCIFNYYFSKHSPEKVDYFFKSNTFRARPEQTFLRAIALAKNRLLNPFQ